MACPPTPPTGVDPAVTSDQIREMIDEAAHTATEGPTQQERDRAYVRMLVLQQYLSDLVNCHMTANVQKLTAEVANLKRALAKSG